MKQVVLLGRYNTGKSTLFNLIVGTKCASTSSKPHTTKKHREIIVTYQKTDVNYVDTPGYSNRNYNPKFFNNKTIYCLVVNHYSWSDLDKRVLRNLHSMKCNVILVVNKIDNTAVDENLKNKFSDWETYCLDILYISARHKHNVSQLIRKIGHVLKVDLKHYKKGVANSIPISVITKSLTKEAIFRYCSGELPHRVNQISVSQYTKCVSIIRIEIIVPKKYYSRVLIHKSPKIKDYVESGLYRYQKVTLAVEITVTVKHI